MSKIFKAVYGAFSFSFLLLCVIFCFYYTKLPDKFYLSVSAPLEIRSFFNITVDYNREETVALQAITSADVSVDEELVILKLFGIIPIKEVKLERIDRPVLVPCGSPFGIKMKTDGAVVTGLGDIDGTPSPARLAGVKQGDIIKSVNGIFIEKGSDITEAVQFATEPTVVVLIRDGVEMSFDITPVESSRDNLFRLGIWVRASSAGIGTLTFYDPQGGTFGGLGHGVCDIDTGKILPLLSGDVVSVIINDVVKGFPGDPGELSGSFLSNVPIGMIEFNTELGLFGTMSYAPSLDSGIPMAFKQEVTTGPAKIFATINGNSPAEYDIYIEKLDYSDSNLTKNMVIRITDGELLGKTGGIVQGMSGSPIIQNGMLAGAVTHVFVNDTTRGYAIFAENMYRKKNELMPQTVWWENEEGIGEPIPSFLMQALNQ